MAHFAQLDESNTVLQVIVVANEELILDGAESETTHTIQLQIISTRHNLILLGY